jgi:hypothetical protein
VQFFKKRECGRPRSPFGKRGDPGLYLCVKSGKVFGMGVGDERSEVLGSDFPVFIWASGVEGGISFNKPITEFINISKNHLGVFRISRENYNKTFPGRGEDATFGFSNL